MNAKCITQNKPCPTPNSNQQHPPTYQSLVADLDGLSDSEELTPLETSSRMIASRKASLNALKLYSGFCYTPMERFCASSPPLLIGDVESLDARYVALEMRMMAGAECEEDRCPGSPRPSSDTLSISRYQEPRKEKKVHVVGRFRNWRMQRRRRSNNTTTHKRTIGSFGSP